MTFTFKPALYDGSTLHELPRPVVAMRLKDRWDFEKLKVPLAAGDTLVGHSLDGVDLAIDGQIVSQAGTLLLSEQDMFAELESLRSALDVSASGTKYEFFLYHDAASATYRKFKQCSTLRFEYDLSDKRLFKYSVEVHAEDPVIYTTAPGM